MSQDVYPLNAIAATDSAVVVGDSAENLWRIVPNGANGQLYVTKNGTTAGFPGVRAVATKTANYTCTTGDSGTWFNTLGATGEVDFTLPAVAGNSGVWYRFTAAANQVMKVIAPAGTLVTYNNAAATSVATGTVDIGHGFELVCDGAMWYAAAMMYVTGNTTVA